jgi:CRP-like cAMP-binding protein
MALDQDIARLAKVPILGALDDGARRLVAFSAETRVLRAGDVLFREGERASCGYFVLTGSFRLTGGPTVNDTDPVLVAPGTLLGETALLREATRPVTAVAQEPSTVLRIGRTLFLRVLREHQGSAEKIEGFLKARLRQQLQDLAG